MSSSEPRLTRSSTVGKQSELTGAETNPLRSNVPLSTHILLVGVMLLFFVVAILVTLQASWQWWVIPAVIAIPVAVVLVERTQRVQKARRARLAMEDELRAEARRRSASGPGASR